MDMNSVFRVRLRRAGLATDLGRPASRFLGTTAVRRHEMNCCDFTALSRRQKYGTIKIAAVDGLKVVRAVPLLRLASPVSPSRPSAGFARAAGPSPRAGRSLFATSHRAFNPCIGVGTSA